MKRPKRTLGESAACSEYKSLKYPEKSLFYRACPRKASVEAHTLDWIFLFSSVEAANRFYFSTPEDVISTNLHFFGGITKGSAIRFEEYLTSSQFNFLKFASSVLQDVDSACDMTEFLKSSWSSVSLDVDGWIIEGDIIILRKDLLRTCSLIDDDKQKVIFNDLIIYLVID